MKELANCRFLHIEDGIERAEAKQIGDDRGTKGRRQDFRALRTFLRSKDAHPDFARLWLVSPEAKKVLQIPRPLGDLAGDGAVNDDGGIGGVLQDAVVG